MTESCFLLFFHQVSWDSFSRFFGDVQHDPAPRNVPQAAGKTNVLTELEAVADTAFAAALHSGDALDATSWDEAYSTALDMASCETQKLARPGARQGYVLSLAAEMEAELRFERAALEGEERRIQATECLCGGPREMPPDLVSMVM